MKMITTLASVARSLAMTRASVLIAGAWMLSLRIQNRQKTGAASLSACIDAEGDGDDRQHGEQADQPVCRQRPAQPRHAVGQAGEAGEFRRRPQPHDVLGEKDDGDDPMTAVSEGIERRRQPVDRRHGDGEQAGAQHATSERRAIAGRRGRYRRVGRSRRRARASKEPLPPRRNLGGLACELQCGADRLRSTRRNWSSRGIPMVWDAGRH